MVTMLEMAGLAEDSCLITLTDKGKPRKSEVKGVCQRRNTHCIAPGAPGVEC